MLMLIRCIVNLNVFVCQKHDNVGGGGEKRLNVQKVDLRAIDVDMRYIKALNVIVHDKDIAKLN